MRFSPGFTINLFPKSLLSWATCSVPFSLSLALLFSPWAFCRWDRQNQRLRRIKQGKGGSFGASLLIGQAQIVFGCIRHQENCVHTSECSKVTTAGLQHSHYFQDCLAWFCSKIFQLQYSKQVCLIAKTADHMKALLFMHDLANVASIPSGQQEDYLLHHWGCVWKRSKAPFAMGKNVRMQLRVMNLTETSLSYDHLRLFVCF